VALFGVAFLGGLISFASPCVLPLLPGYLSYISGVSVQDLQEGRKGKSRHVLYTTLLFVLGFSIIFTLLGSAAGVIGDLLFDYLATIEKIAGAIIVIMGIFLTGIIKIPALYREMRFMPKSRRFGNLSAVPLGMAFAVGWTPCVGPILAVIYSLAISSPNQGAALLFVYSMGLGIPFILSGLLFSKLSGSLNWLKRHSQAIQAVSGIILIAFGVLLLTGQLTALIAPLQGAFQPQLGLEDSLLGQ